MARDINTSTQEFDADGNVVRLGDLTFCEGILGQGECGTVRLARRRRTERDSTVRMTESLTGATENGDSHPRHSSARRTSDLERSASAPSDFLFGGGFGSPGGSSASSRSFFVRNRMLSSFTTQFSDGGMDTDDELVAVKIFTKSLLKRMRTLERDKATHRVKVKTGLEQVEREIALMKKLSHPNLVRLYDVLDSPESDILCLVMEYMPLGEILTYQHDGTFRRKEPKQGQPQILNGLVNGHFNEEQSALYFVDILHGLAYLHLHHICHRDIKPENIL